MRWLWHGYRVCNRRGVRATGRFFALPPVQRNAAGQAKPHGRGSS